MKKIFIIIFLAAAAIIVGLVFHKPLLAGVNFLFERPYRGLTDDQLDARIAAAGAELAEIQRHYDGLPTGLPDHSLSQHATAREFTDQSGGVLDRWRALRTEKIWRATRNTFYPYAGMLISAIVFLNVSWRIMRERDPKVRKRQEFQRGLDRELARDRAARPAKDQARRLEAMSAVDPRLNKLQPGSSSRQDVMDLLGQPHERTVFLEYEAWIYYLPRPEAAGAAEQDAGDDPWETASPELAPRERPDHAPVTILFSGNLVHDLSIGTIRDQKDMRRAL